MSPPLPLDQWVADLCASPRGRIWWSNLVYDVRTGNLPCRVYARLRGAVRGGGTLADRAPAAGGLRLSADARAALALDALSVIDQHADRFCMQGTRAPRPCDLARVIDAPAFGAFHVSPELGEKLDDQTGERCFRLLGRTILPRHYHGLMRTGRPYFWATTTRALDEAMRAAQAADAVRDRLGLGHVAEGTRLLRVDIPAAELSGVAVRAPTTLDAGDSPWFAPRYDDAGYGWTRHLPTMDPGAPEVVVAPVPLSERCTVHRIGVTGTPPQVDLDGWADRCASRACP